MSILDEIRELRKESQDIRQKIQNLSEQLLYSENEIVFCRINVLDEWYSCLKGAEPYAKRQILPQRIIAGYNGRVRVDVKLVRRYEGLLEEGIEEGISEHVAEWKEAFEKHYGISFDVVNEKMGSLRGILPG